jgi:hypothetical protein
VGNSLELPLADLLAAKEKKNAEKHYVTAESVLAKTKANEKTRYDIMFSLGNNLIEP